jgi:tRNA_anti-like
MMSFWGSVQVRLSRHPNSLVAVVIAGCKKAPDERSEKQKAVERVKGKADLSTTADDLGEEYFKDGNSMKTLHEGKVIELTGVVRSFYRNENGPSLELGVKDRTAGFSVFPIDQKPWEKVLPGQTVRLNVMCVQKESTVNGFKLTGIGTQFIGGPILEVTGNPPPVLTAESIAKEMLANSSLATAKYRSAKSALVITGEVVQAVEKNGVLEQSLLYLKTGTKLGMKCTTDAESVRGLKPGMRVTVAGNFSELGTENEISIISCVVIAIHN